MVCNPLACDDLQDSLERRMKMEKVLKDTSLAADKF